MPGAEYVRVCTCGCKNELRDKNGEPDFDRVFFSFECRRRDKIARIAAQRARKKQKRKLRKTCADCGRKKTRTWLTVHRRDGRRVKVGVMNHDTAEEIIAAAAMPPDPPPIKKRRPRA